MKTHLGRRGGLAAAALAGIAGSAAAQDCMWSSQATAGPGDMTAFRGVFDGTRALLAGIVSGSAVQLWAWEPSGWTQLSAGGGPAVRAGHALAYDSARGRLVLHAGRLGNAYYRDTWEWDGAAWSLRANNTGPSGRGYHAMAFDSARGRCVMFGGDAMATDTWEWDGTQWFNVPSAPSPPGRSQAGMVYDSDRGRVVLFGGTDGASLNRSDTWEWDGSGWVERLHTGPDQSFRVFGLRMVFDPVRHRTVLLTGSMPNNGSVYSSETWEYDGAAATWTLRNGGGTAQSQHGPFVFDTVRSVGQLLETATTRWEWRGGAPAEPAYITLQPQSSLLVPLGGSAQFTVAAAGTGPISLRWYHGAVALANGGNISGADTPTLTINPVGLGDYGRYTAVATNACGSATSGYGEVRVLSQCYANCDSSTTPPFLNVLDIGCFLNRFAAGCLPTDCYVNCDGSTTPPVLNVLDFGCYLNAYAGGCTVP